MNTIFQVLLRQNFRCGRMESIRAVSMAGRAERHISCPGAVRRPPGFLLRRGERMGERAAGGIGKNMDIYSKRRVSHGGLGKETKESERKVKF